MDKNSIRSKIIELRKQASEEQRREESDRIAKNLYHLPQFEQCSAVYSYVSFQEEVITDTILEYALQQGKKIAVPKVLGKQIDFFYIQGKQDLKAGYWGIMEPINTNTPAHDSQVLLLMPGLAFDSQHNRIGYGGGFYDRYLEDHKHINFYKAALSYEFQIVPHIPYEEYDKKVDCIITPNRVL
jgi:5-formyltetrahydrofolate cyclo-ligase